MICVGIDEFYDVWERVKSLSPRWFFISGSLRLNPNTLALIEANNGNNCEKCLFEALTHWLNKNYDVIRFGHPSWRKLCVSVSNGGQNKALAEEIANEHLVPPTSPSTGCEQTPSVTSDGEQGNFCIDFKLMSLKIITIVTSLSLPSGHTISLSQIFSRDKGKLIVLLCNICVYYRQYITTSNC